MGNHIECVTFQKKKRKKEGLKREPTYQGGIQVRGPIVIKPIHPHSR